MCYGISSYNTEVAKVETIITLGLDRSNITEKAKVETPAPLQAISKTFCVCCIRVRYIYTIFQLFGN
jgi:hypothetical protein